MEDLPRLRPRPWPITPLGPYRLRPDGKLERFRTTGAEVIRWIEDHCVFTKDRWVRQPFRLLPWQKQLLLDLFEQVWDEDLQRWRRRYRTAYIGVPKKNGKCLAAESAVTLADGSRRAAGELRVGDEVLAYASGKLVAAKVSAVEKMALAPIVEVETARGRVLRTTAHHPYLVRGSKLAPSLDPKRGEERWVNAENLAVGDRVVVALGFGVDGDAAAWDQAYALGVLVGDGDGQGRFSTTDPEVLAALPWPATPIGTSGRDYYLRGVLPFMREHRIEGGNARSKRVPAAVMEGGTAAGAAFLSGYLDTDGTVTRPSREVEWYSVNRELLEDCQHLLAALGINASLGAKRGRYNGDVHHSWRLAVRGRGQLARLHEVLRPRVERKRAALEQLAGEPHRWVADSFATDRVKAVRWLDAAPTIGVEVEGHHTHVTAGLVTHNTELVAAIAVWFLLGSGEPDPRIACAAAAETQADMVFGAAATMIEQSPTLRHRADVFVREVVGRGGGFVKRVPANGGKFDGQNLLMGAGDELHEWLTPNQRKMHGMLSGAFATREEPMHFCITTAGEDTGEADEDFVPPWLRMYRYGRQIETGEIDDGTFFFRWWMADPGCDHRDPGVWADPAVNPSYGETVNEAFYRAELGKRTESEFRRYYLNQPVESVNIWLEHGAWEACAVPGLTRDPSLPTWMGWDASTKRDSTAIVLGQWREIAGRRRFAVWARVWERPPRPDGSPDPGWKVPKAEVVEWVAARMEEGVVEECDYDPFAIAWIVEALEERGFPMVETPQNDTRMVPATNALYEMIIDGDLAHDGDPVLARHIKGAKVKSLPRGGQRLVKSDRGRHIDAAIALVLCIGAAVLGEPEDKKGPVDLGMDFADI